ncbi:MAG: M48 family metallopeptidase [Deltaproteobacteria bacterium]|nr:M48 family metallopeptidase [Deltaproteobacteria bacterium]
MIPVKDFKREVFNWADEIGVRPREVHVREMKRKWASCSSKGRLTFSYALLNRPEEERALAIVHELLHLRYPNHNKMFRSMLSGYLGKKGIDVNNVKLGEAADRFHNRPTQVF